jgi:hypothetical protein
MPASKQKQRRKPTVMPANFVFQVVIGIDRLMHDALGWHGQNIYPHKSRSEFCREAIFEKLAREFPQAFKKSETIAAE